MNRFNIRPAREALTSTHVSLKTVLSNPRLRALTGIVTFGYAVVYLIAIGHIAPGLGGFDITIVRNPFGRVFAMQGPFSFAPILSARIGALTYLFSLNTVIAFGIGVLIGLNATLSYLGWSYPDQCGTQGSYVGVVTGLPTIISGTACCGPVIFILLGVQASAVFLTAVEVLLPLAVAILASSVILSSSQINWTAVDISGAD